jgi:hypothetical protein
MLHLGALCGLLLGLVLVALMRLLVPRLFPSQGVLYPGYYIGLLPTNPDGTFAPRDYWQMAGFSIAGAAVCLVLTFAVSLVVDAVPMPPTPRLVVEGLMFPLMVLAMLCVASALVQLARAVRWRPRRLACDWPRGDFG